MGRIVVVKQFVGTTAVEAAEAVVVVAAAVAAGWAGAGGRLVAMEADYRESAVLGSAALVALGEGKVLD
jgi:hypothetical protein